MLLRARRRALARTSVAALTVGIASAVSASANAASFDAASGTFRLEPDAVVASSLDSPEALGLPARIFVARHEQGFAYLDGSPETLATVDFVPALHAAEGKGALRVRADRAVLLGDPASLAGAVAGRVEVRVLARADGAMPELRAIYARSVLEPPEASFPLAQVVALRTSRATTDGFIELTTGPIDGAIAGAPLAGLLLVAAGSAPKGASFLVDALEIRRVSPTPVSGGACTVAHESDDCRKGATCIEGLCLDSAVVYGALPDEEARADIVARTATYLTRFQDDRHAVAAATAGFAKEMPAIASTADSPAAFYRSFAASVGAARGAHTAAPAPKPYSRAAAGATSFVRQVGTELNACFGLVEMDLAGGGRGYGVYAVTSKSSLRVGDVITHVDGESVDAWIARLAPEHGVLGADPDSDRPMIASQLHLLVARYAATTDVKRCTSAGACETVAVDVAALRRQGESVAEPLVCSPRFELGVEVPFGVDEHAYEAAIAHIAPDGVLTLHTNGEPTDDPTWVNVVKGAFDAGSDRLLVDKRRGDGGGGDALATWGRYMRRGTGYGIFFVSRVDHTHVDGPPGFLDELLGSCSGHSFFGRCVLAQHESYPAQPGALPRKVAWLTVLDGSASDMSTYFARGAPGTRIFGPNRTLGLFGALGVMGSFLPGWTGGYVQFGDVRSGTTPEERRAGAWRSGRGVEPDEIVVQLQSDLVLGKDAMLARAHAWLNEP